MSDISPKFWTGLQELMRVRVDGIIEDGESCGALLLEDITDSPIERTLLLAIMMQWNAYGYGVQVYTQQVDGISNLGLRGIHLITQAEVLNYRVDMVLQSQEYPSVRFAIECDGHEFHEKTKQQAAKDKRRDRELTMRGLRVLHYTGSEIYNDPFGCALDIFTHFDGACADVGSDGGRFTGYKL